MCLRTSKLCSKVPFCFGLFSLFWGLFPLVSLLALGEGTTLPMVHWGATHSCSSRGGKAAKRKISRTLEAVVRTRLRSFDQ